MDILTWNINGIRASKVAINDLLESLKADVICLQETKVTRDLLDNSIANVEGYNSYFSFSKKRTGYSGVVTYCRDNVTPVRAEEGLTGRLAKDKDAVIGCYGNMTSFTDEELQSLDGEGRAVMTQHQIRTQDGDLSDLVIINVYCPRADRDNEERMRYKLQFYNLLQARAESLVKNGRYVIIVGDVNASHRPIDSCDPSLDFESHPSRQWLNSFLCDSPSKEAGEEATTDSNEDTEQPSDPQTSSRGSFVDTFRKFHPTRTKAYTCWSTMTGARQTNYGTRIDYIFANAKLCVKMLLDCDIMPEVEGSDHCPVKARINCEPVPSAKLPPLCSRCMPEFSGKQQKLMSFFQKLSPGKVAAIQQREDFRENATVNFKTGVKRTASDNSHQSSQKKVKTDAAAARKGSLMNFFIRKNPTEADRRKSEMPDISIDTTNLKSSKAVPVSHYGNSESSKATLEESQDTDSSPEVPAKESSTLPDNRKDAASAWKKLLSGLPPAPLCTGHNEACLLRTVKKPGPNLGKKFYVCSKPEGHKDNPQARCNTFIWAQAKSK